MNQQEIFKNMIKGEVHRCSRCNEKLKSMRWLELSITDEQLRQSEELIQERLLIALKFISTINRS
jgi:hypothetical protein